MKGQKSTAIRFWDIVQPFSLWGCCIYFDRPTNLLYGRCISLAVFTLEMDHLSETGYPLDNSCQTNNMSKSENGMVLILDGQSA